MVVQGYLLSIVHPISILSAYNMVAINQLFGHVSFALKTLEAYIVPGGYLTCFAK